MKNDLQKLAIRNIEESQIKSALKNILNLGKIVYFEENNTTEGFDHKKLLDVEPSRNLDLQLQDKKISLINHLLFIISSTYMIDSKISFLFK